MPAPQLRKEVCANLCRGAAGRSELPVVSSELDQKIATENIEPLSAVLHSNNIDEYILLFLQLLKYPSFRTILICSFNFIASQNAMQSLCRNGCINDSNTYTSLVYHNLHKYDEEIISGKQFS